MVIGHAVRGESDHALETARAAFLSLWLLVPVEARTQTPGPPSQVRPTSRVRMPPILVIIEYGRITIEADVASLDSVLHEVGWPQSFVTTGASLRVMFSGPAARLAVQRRLKDVNYVVVESKAVPRGYPYTPTTEIPSSRASRPPARRRPSVAVPPASRPLAARAAPTPPSWLPFANSSTGVHADREARALVSWPCTLRGRGAARPPSTSRREQTPSCSRARWRPWTTCEGARPSALDFIPRERRKDLASRRRDGGAPRRQRHGRARPAHADLDGREDRWSSERTLRARGPDALRMLAADLADEVPSSGSSSFSSARRQAFGDPEATPRSVPARCPLGAESIAARRPFVGEDPEQLAEAGKRVEHRSTASTWSRGTCAGAPVHDQAWTAALAHASRMTRARQSARRARCPIPPRCGRPLSSSR